MVFFKRNVLPSPRAKKVGRNFFFFVFYLGNASTIYPLAPESPTSPNSSLVARAPNVRREMDFVGLGGKGGYGKGDMKMVFGRNRGVGYSLGEVF